MPSAGGVYSWASVTPGPRKGRLIGFLAGYTNAMGWVFALAGVAYLLSQIILQMYVIYHPTFVPQPWHSFVALVGLTWSAVAIMVFYNKILRHIATLGFWAVFLGGIVTTIVLAAMPKQHASHSFVWTDWQNDSGWVDGMAFLIGVVQGGYTIGTVDGATHIAEELPNPRRDLPKAIAAQMILGTFCAFIFMTALFYGISDFDAVLNSTFQFPLTEVYLQATNGSQGATFGLLFIILLCYASAFFGTFLTTSRCLWALARDKAIPFPKVFGYVDEKRSCPIPATILAGVFTTAFGAIGLGSPTALSDLAGSFTVLTSISYAIAILPHWLTGRKNVPKGPFWMGSWGPWVNGIAVISTLVFDTFFCFPYLLPVTAASMNYTSVILVGILAFAGVWWLVYASRHYEGPKIARMYNNNVLSNAKALSTI